MPRLVAGVVGVVVAATVAVLLLSRPAAVGAPICTVNFNTTAGGSFFTAANWNDATTPSVHRVPGASDYACIAPAVAGTVTFSTGASTTVAGLSAKGTGGFIIGSGTLTLTDTVNRSTIANATVSGGTVTGAGALTLTGLSTWARGTLDGPGTVTVTSGASLTLPPTALGNRTLLRPLINQGVIAVSHAVTAGLLVGNGATITNAAAGTIDLQGDDADFSPIAAGGSITNAGVVKRSSGDGTTTIALPLTTSLGGLQVQTGTVSLTGGGSMSGTGTVAANSVLGFDSGMFALTNAALGGVGSTRLGAASWVLAGTNTLNMSSVIAGGTIDGAGSLVFAAAGTWSRGTMQGTGKVTVNAGVTLTLPVTQFGDRTLRRPLKNLGTIAIAHGVQAGLIVGNDATITNALGATIDLQGDNADIALFGTGGSIVNSGVVKRSSGEGTAEIEIAITSALDNVQALSGTLSLSGGGVLSGQATTPEGSTLKLADGTFTVSSATFGGGGSNQLGDATMTLNGSSTANGSFSIVGGTVSGSGSLTITGSAVWARGLMKGTGTVTVAPGAGLALPQTVSGDRTLERPLVNQGTMTIARGLSSGLTVGLGATLTNASSGVIELEDDAGHIASSVPSGTMINDGRLTKVTGFGTTTISVPLDNNGTVAVDTGTLSLADLAAYEVATKTLTKGTYTIAGVLAVKDADIVHNRGSIALSGPAAQFTNASNGKSALLSLVDNQQGGSLALLDGAALSASAFTNAGSLTVDASSTLAVTTGSFVQSASGVAAVELGGADDPISVMGAAALAGTLQLSTLDGVTPATGQAFDIVSSGTRTGCFSAITGRDLSAFAPGLYYDVACTPTGATASVKRVRLSVADVSVVEGNSGSKLVTFTLSLSHSRPDVAVTAMWTTHAGSAIAPSDFVVASGTVTWLVGEGGDRTVTVKVKGDTAVEPDESFTVDIVAATGAFVVDGSGKGTILNDD